MPRIAVDREGVSGDDAVGQSPRSPCPRPRSSRARHFATVLGLLVHVIGRSAHWVKTSKAVPTCSIVPARVCTRK